MARTKQTARKSTGGKAPRNTAAYANWESRGKGGKPIAQKKKQERQPAANSNSLAFSPIFPAPVLKIPIEENDAPVEITYDLSYESVFFQHYFDTGVEKEKTFSPVFKTANTLEPYTLPFANPAGPILKEGDLQHWIHFYFNSKLDGLASQGVRPDLHLAIALDISGSMCSPFPGEAGRSKMQVAQQSLLTLLRQLRPADSFGLVLFNNEARVIQPLQSWKEIDALDLEKQIMKLRATGGTSISAAVKEATNMFTSKETEREGYSNRIIYLTDLQVGPNDGQLFKTSVQANSNNNLWSTVVGVGLDLTQDIIKHVSKTPGCNYCNVRSTATFDELMTQEFASTVSPIAFNIQVSLQSDRYRIVAGYGTPEVSDLKPGEMVNFSTEFPSVKNAQGETRSGAILFRVEDRFSGVADAPPHQEFKMSVTWDDLSGVRCKDVQTLNFGSLQTAPITTTTTTTTSTPTGESTHTPIPEELHQAPFYQSSAVRKAILLVRYTDFFKKYIELRSAENTPAVMETFQKMRKVYHSVVDYLRSEMKLIEDPSLNEELGNLLEMAQMDDIPLDQPTITEEEKSEKGEKSEENKNENNNSADNKRKESEGKSDSKPKKPKVGESDYAKELHSKSRAELQELARAKGLKANAKSDKIISDLAKIHAKEHPDDDSGMCCVCLAEPKTITLRPCNHQCLCVNCSSSHTYAICPLCRSPVASLDANSS